MLNNLYLRKENQTKEQAEWQSDDATICERADSSKNEIQPTEGLDLVNAPSYLSKYILFIWA